MDILELEMKLLDVLGVETVYAELTNFFTTDQMLEAYKSIAKDYDIEINE